VLPNECLPPLIPLPIGTSSFVIESIMSLLSATQSIRSTLTTVDFNHCSSLYISSFSFSLKRCSVNVSFCIALMNFWLSIWLHKKKLFCWVLHNLLPNLLEGCNPCWTRMILHLDVKQIPTTN